MLVMTYNIQGYAAERQQDHIIKIAETVAAARPDVVALQEVYCRKSGDQGAQVAHLAGLQLVFGKSCEINGGDYGNAILTRGTIEHSAVHPLPGAGEPRSLLEACIAIDGARFTFFATHLAAWGRLLRAARLEQIAKLGDITARAGSPHLLAGDFNVTPRAEELRALLAHGHLRYCGDLREPTFPSTRQRLDYIFCDAAWEVVETRVIRRGPSDHWPLVADVVRSSSSQAS
jgi:endonuclease/exonuclease/phosphatase family metal-dependent hydrolase